MINSYMKLLTYEQVLSRFREIHQNKYDYSKFISYHKDYDSKITIICKIHGEFSQTVANHIKGKGCGFCANNIKSTDTLFITKAKKIHGDRYDYSKVNYINWKTKVIIICKIHGEYHQSPNNHLNGQNCPTCSDKNNSVGIVKIRKYLDNRKIDYVTEHKFDNCTNIKKLPFDIYIPLINICIEYDGQQHFRGWRGNKKSLDKIIHNDNIKTHYCQTNNIRLLRISYHQIENMHRILDNFLILSDQIVNI